MFTLRPLHILKKWGFFQTLSTASFRETVLAEPLQDRCLLRVSGPDSYDLLQGLITNDISHLQAGAPSMYTMFLNSRGRVLYDAIIYRTKESSALYIECDSTVQANLEKHLTMYRLRKKVDIGIEENQTVWSVYNASLDEKRHCDNLMETVKKTFPGQVIASDDVEPVNKNESYCLQSPTSLNDILIFKDPRILDLGLRVLCSSSEDLPKLLSVKKGSMYRQFKYSLGVGEGALDLPKEECLPLESNCDYLHGVSFHKGCYIGQELTARVHHTGVVRKRIMPFVLDRPVNVSNATKQDIINEDGKPVGKLRGVEGLVGIGLLRVAEVLSAKGLSLCSTNLKTRRPDWWPQEAPKEIESRGKQ